MFSNVVCCSSNNEYLWRKGLVVTCTCIMSYSDSFTIPQCFNLSYFQYGCPSLITVIDLKITCLSGLCVWIPPVTLESFMLGRYLASLWNISGSTQVPACAWINTRRGSWGLLPPIKLESLHYNLIQCWCNVKPGPHTISFQETMMYYNCNKWQMIVELFLL